MNWKLEMKIEPVIWIIVVAILFTVVSSDFQLDEETESGNLQYDEIEAVDDEQNDEEGNLNFISKFTNKAAEIPNLAKNFIPFRFR